MKTCTKCNTEKDESCFKVRKERKGALNSMCRDCCSIQRREYKDKNKEKLRQNNKEYYDRTKESTREKKRLYREKNKEKQRIQKQIYRQNNKDRIKERTRLYEQNNKEKIAKRKKEYSKKNPEKTEQRRRKWVEQNKEKVCEYSRNYKQNNQDKELEYRKKNRDLNKEKARERYRNEVDKDPLPMRKKRHDYFQRTKKERSKHLIDKIKSNPIFRLQSRIRGTVGLAIRNKGFSKKSKTSQIVGCSYEELLEHLIKTAVKNYGYFSSAIKYEIDHINPLATAKTEDDVLKLNHYSNLQYLYSHDNGKKRDRLDFVLPTPKWSFPLQTQEELDDWQREVDKLIALDGKRVLPLQTEQEYLDLLK